MSTWSRLSMAERRVSLMAEKNGADLTVATQSGFLLPEDYRDAIHACSGCSQPDTCDQFLSRDEDGTPDYCRNTALIRRLAEVTPD